MQSIRWVLPLPHPALGVASSGLAGWLPALTAAAGLHYLGASSMTAHSLAGKQSVGGWGYRQHEHRDSVTGQGEKGKQQNEKKEVVGF